MLCAHELRARLESNTPTEETIERGEDRNVFIPYSTASEMELLGGVKTRQQRIKANRGSESQPQKKMTTKIQRQRTTLAIPRSLSNEKKKIMTGESYYQ